MKSKYYIRVMRPTFQRAVLTVEAESEEAAVCSALEKAEHLSEFDWVQLETVLELPVVEAVLSEADMEEDIDEDSGADALEFMSGGRHEYALLQADIEEGEGTFIAPIWLKNLPELAAADITQDWSEALSGVSGDETEGFYAWLTQQGRPSNVVDFLAERDRRRGMPSADSGADE